MSTRRLSRHFLFSILLLCLRPVFSAEGVLEALSHPQAAARGHAGTASLSGNEAILYNPAAIHLPAEGYFSAGYNLGRYILDTGWHMAGVVYSWRGGWSTGAGFAWFNSGEMVYSPEGSLSKDSEGYYTSLETGNYFALKNQIFFATAAYLLPFGLSAGVTAKFDYTSVLEYQSRGIAADAGVLYTPEFSPHMRTYLPTFLLPARTAIVIRNIGIQGAFLDENGISIPKKKLTGAVVFSPMFRASQLRIHYGVEMGIELEPRVHTGATVDLGKMYAEVTAGIQAANPFMHHAGAGILIGTDFLKLPMRAGYTIEYYGRTGLTHSFFYSVCVQLLGKNARVETALGQITALMNKRQYLQAFNLAREMYDKTGDPRLREAVNTAQYMLIKNESDFID